MRWTQEVRLSTLAAILALGCASSDPKKEATDPALNALIARAERHQIEYDKSSIHLTNQGVNQMLNASYKVEVTHSILYTDPETGEPAITEVGGHGSGTVLHYGDGYIYVLTCEHVVSFDPYANEELAETNIRLSHGGQSVEMEVLVESAEHDIALLRSKYKLKYEGAVIKEFANPFDLMPGDVSYVVGYPGPEGRILTRGIVSGTGNIPISGIGNYTISDAVINPGNSGGGLFVLIKGKPVLAGMSQITTYNKGLFGFVTIGEIYEVFALNGYGFVLK